MSLLPFDPRRILFFVPQALASTLRMGQRVVVHCDGCKQELQASVNFTSPQAEYTPPEIYGRDVRDKLVFRIEDIPAPEAAMQLKPGLPINVRLQLTPLAFINSISLMATNAWCTT